jgi:hypothetical protein
MRFGEACNPLFPARVANCIGLCGAVELLSFLGQLGPVKGRAKCACRYQESIPMCDELTIADDDANAAANAIERGLSRRQFAAMSAAGAAAAMAGAEQAIAAGAALKENAVTITTPMANATPSLSTPPRASTPALSYGPTLPVRATRTR